MFSHISELLTLFAFMSGFDQLGNAMDRHIDELISLVIFLNLSEIDLNDYDY